MDVIGAFYGSGVGSGAGYSHWNWIYLGPLLALQGCFFIAVLRANTVRFQQLALSLWGIFWSLVVYYVQYYDGSRVLFCDVSANSSCSNCLRSSIAHLPAHFGMVDAGSWMNRSIADTSLLYYGLHIIFPLIQKFPVVGKWLTHVGFVVSTIVSGFCLHFSYKIWWAGRGDLCLICLVLYLINWGLNRTMWNYLKKQFLRGMANGAHKTE